MIKHGYKLLVLSVATIMIAFIFSDVAEFFLFFLTPIFAISGIFFVVRGKYIKPKLSNQPSKLRPYRFPILLLQIATVSILIAMYTIWDVRRSAGYSGSEAEIAAIPFGFVFIVSSFLAVVSYIVVVIKRKKNS